MSYLSGIGRFRLPTSFRGSVPKTVTRPRARCHVVATRRKLP